MATVGVAEALTFQSESTALTVTETWEPTVVSVGLPVRPVKLPGAAVSPGRRTWSLVALPALTVSALVVPAVSGVPGAVVSVALMVREPAVRRVALKDRDPPAGPHWRRWT
jgi:hypothetical protein